MQRFFRSKLKPVLFILTVSTLFAACGGGGGGDGSTSEPEGGDFLTGNPIVSTQFFGESGNLYKPASDETSSGQGNLVVLLSSQFTTQFDSCEMRKANGEIAQLICINDQPWTHVPFSCFSNGGRQTWRANFRCNEAAEVRVVCRDLNQEVTFTVPDAALGHVCTRFG
ncbi:MAG: hypothetical protein J5J00_14000 [Deltaproteobacteria bacterium]|nr:hypothetical protein [Deltaproteobacteria bacterium]